MISAGRCLLEETDHILDLDLWNCLKPRFRAGQVARKPPNNPNPIARASPTAWDQDDLPQAWTASPNGARVGLSGACSATTPLSPLNWQSQANCRSTLEAKIDYY
jgi:hypothetical protein